MGVGPIDFLAVASPFFAGMERYVFVFYAIIGCKITNFNSHGI
jgi:hypothetical protein